MYGSPKKYRDMSKIKTPKFKAPEKHDTIRRGNNECKISCITKFLPRNTLLIRPKHRNDRLSSDLYDLMEKTFNRGELDRLSMGSCQVFIRKDTIKAVFGRVLTDKDLTNKLLSLVTIKCLDNIDNTLLKRGDIVLERVGSKRSVGKPHLILEEISK